jgi:hypothetical protein
LDVLTRGEGYGRPYPAIRSALFFASEWVTGSTARRFQPLSQLPKRELSKIWRKAGDSNAYVPRDPGLADQWDTNYPSLPGKD